MTTDMTPLFVPPAAEGLPLAALDSATEGANRLDSLALDPRGRNFLAHALVQLARDGWLRTEPSEGFEPVPDERATPEPQPAVSSVGQAPATNQTALREQIAEAIRAAACPGDCGLTEEECAKTRIQPFAWHHGRLAVVEGEPEMFADAVLAVLPTVDRTAVLREAADIAEDVAESLRKHHEFERSTGALDVMTELRRLAAESAGRVADDTQPLRTERLRAADLLEARNPDRNADFSEGVDWAIDELRCMTDPDLPAVGGAQQQEDDRG